MAGSNRNASSQGRRKERRRVVGAFVVGAVLGAPLFAHSKGQWCSDTHASRVVKLSLRSSTVDGEESAFDAGLFDLRLTAQPDAAAIAVVADPDCISGTASCLAGARERRLVRSP